MTGSLNEFLRRQFCIEKLMWAARECRGWTYAYVSTLENEPILAWTNDTSGSDTPFWGVEICPLQRWQEDSNNVIQIAISIHDEPLHFGTVMEFYSDDRQPDLNDVAEFFHGLPTKLGLL